MKKPFYTAAMIFAILFSGCMSRSYPTRDRHALEAVVESIDSLLASYSVGTVHVGVAAQSMSTGEWVYYHNTDKLFTPASTAKLFTSVTALSILGPEWQFVTSAVTDSTISNGSLRGNLYLVGSGDPTLTTEDLERLAHGLVRQGISEVKGDLVLDASRFDSKLYGPGWMWDDGPYAFNAPVSGLNLNGNCITLTVRPGSEKGSPVVVIPSPKNFYGRIINTAVTGSHEPLSIGRSQDEEGLDVWEVSGGMGLLASPLTSVRSVTRPLAYAGKLWAESLKGAGIVHRGVVRTGVAPESARVLSSHCSASLDVIVRRYLKKSHNLTGEALVKTLAWQANNQPGSWPSGMSVVRRWMTKEAGIDSMRYRLVDGSGLSRYSLISPLHLVRALASGYHRYEFAPEFMSALPVAGRDGTMRRRLAGRVPDGDVRVKTGSMAGVSGLAGFLRTEDGEVLACAILFNGFVSGNPRSVQDQIVEHLRRVPAPGGRPNLANFGR